MLEDDLRQALSYDKHTGEIHWKVHVRRRKAGAIAGHIKKDTGYRSLKFRGVHYLSHRVAWLLHYGKWPDGQIDHINGVRTDNRICNLREATHLLNAQNRRAACHHNKTGFLGVWKQGKKFVALIRFGGRQHRLGSFATAEEAHQAYLSHKRMTQEGCSI